MEGKCSLAKITEYFPAYSARGYEKNEKRALFFFLDEGRKLKNWRNETVWWFYRTRHIQVDRGLGLILSKNVIFLLGFTTFSNPPCLHSPWPHNLLGREGWLADINLYLSPGLSVGWGCLGIHNKVLGISKCFVYDHQICGADPGVWGLVLLSSGHGRAEDVRLLIKQPLLAPSVRDLVA